VASDAEEFVDPMEAAPGAAEVDPGKMVSVAATTDGKKKRTRAKKKAATSNPGAKASDVASVASTSSLPPKPTVSSLFGGDSAPLAPGPWASTVERQEARRQEKRKLAIEIAALQAQMADSSDEDDDYVPRSNF
jgi:hypothetical protein